MRRPFSYHRELDRFDVEECVFQRNQRQARDRIAGCGARPIVERELELAKRQHVGQVLARALGNRAGLVIHHRDGAGRIVAVEPVDVSDERVLAELDVGLRFAADHFEGRFARALEQPGEIASAVRRARRFCNLELDRRIEARAVTVERRRVMQ